MFKDIYLCNISVKIRMVVIRSKCKLVVILRESGKGINKGFKYIWNGLFFKLGGVYIGICYVVF